MRTWQVSIAAVLVMAAGCTGKMAPGQPFDNITAHNTENTGDWRVLDRTERDGRVVFRIAADHPEDADRIAHKAIDQWLGRSPAEVVVDVYAASNQSGAPVAHVLWQRPSTIRVATDVPDTRGSVSSDRQGSPERAVGAHDR